VLTDVVASGPAMFDVLFYGSINERRRAVLEDLRARGLRVLSSPMGVYGTSRNAWIVRSKNVSNIHLRERQVFEIARVSYLLANKRVVVYERRPDPTEERDLESGIAFANYDELADRCLELLDDERARRELGKRGLPGLLRAQRGRRPAPRTVGKRRVRSGHSGSSNWTQRLSASMRPHGGDRRAKLSYRLVVDTPVGTVSVDRQYGRSDCVTFTEIVDGHLALLYFKIVHDHEAAIRHLVIKRIQRLHC
jgi:hypothetical protein